MRHSPDATIVAELTWTEAAAATGGRVIQGDGNVEISGFSIDTRTLKRGDLFVAIVGPNHDGHDYVRAALDSGAAGAVISRPVETSERGILLQVADTTRGMQELAAHVRRREVVQVVGITGSTGKTTTKEMAHHLLSGPLQAYRSEGNLNNLYGLPLALLRMPAGAQVAILEMGMSYPGELRRLAEIASPDVGVLTNVGMAHMANFGSLEEIARAKEELFEGMAGKGTGIFNADDEHGKAMADRFGGFTFTYGIEQGADLMAEGIRQHGLEGTELTIRHADRTWPVRIGLSGLHHVYNLLAALSSGFMLGCDMDTMVERAAGLAALPGRGELLELPGGVQVLDDTYNSNPAAVRRALSALVTVAASRGRRILVTGDMLELGSHGPGAHQDVGRLAGDARIEVVVAVGPLSAETARTAREAGVGEVVHCEDSREAARAVAALVRAGDTVLVKGSRGMKMERVVQRLREETAARS